MQAPREYVRAYLQGLFDTDGHAEKQKGYIEYCSASEKLAQQVHMLLLQFGIIGKLQFRPNPQKGAWYLHIRGDAKLFYE